MTEALTCRELVELVTDYLERDLAETDVERFETHLATCPGCATYVDQFRETIRLTGRLREDDIEPAARETLLEEFRNWKESNG
jgi:anti-sigma factor RsiW